MAGKLRFTKLLIATLVATGLVLSAGLATEVQAAPEYRWKLAMTWPTNFPIFGDAVLKMADMVKEMSNGEMEIRVDSKNKHKAPFGVLDMVKAGQYEMGHSASYYWKGMDIKTLLFTTMPFGLIATEQHTWFYDRGGIELMPTHYDKNRL